MPLRQTKKQKQILEALRRHRGTLSAKELHRKLPEIDLATIYRNLDRFVKERLITRVHLDTGEAHYEYQEQPHHHAICTECKRVIHFSAPEKKLQQLLDLPDFDVAEIELTVRGSCTHKK